ncbi:hypothetical protein JCGZ_05091 [Jatropha curcas]|uniref:Aminotransferase-like plant mobile domain-containing protein n=1 Tax=Jatropha curcas TaxID=180498 RepID=A0A067J9U9_JATCU|nr:hypothetical protein JCGZ_05091 [Jatropha curcas]
MSQLPEIPSSAYTPEMNTLGAIPDITTFEGEPVSVSWNPLTPETRPLQLLPLPGTEFPVRYETSGMRDFQTEVDHGKARAGGSSTDAFAFWDLLDPPMRARVVAVGFGDYAAGLCHTQPRFPPVMHYALMERWTDCTHTFVFGFGEMTLTPAYYAAITGLRFDGLVAPLDARYQTAALGDLLLLGRADPDEAGRVERVTASAYTQEERDQAGRSFLFYIISSELLCTSQNKEDPAVLVSLRDLSQVGSYDWATPALAHLYHGLDVWAYEYRIYPGGPSGDTPTDSRRIPRYLAHYHHTFASTEDPHYWRCFLNDRALSDLLLTPWEGEAWRTYPACAVAELYTRSRLLLRGTGLTGACSKVLGAMSEDLEIGRLRRHQSRQSSAVSRLQLEVDRLRTRLEVEGIPLDFSKEDDDGSSSDDAPPSPPPQAAAGPSRRRR